MIKSICLSAAAVALLSTSAFAAEYIVVQDSASKK